MAVMQNSRLTFSPDFWAQLSSFETAQLLYRNLPSQEARTERFATFPERSSSDKTVYQWRGERSRDVSSEIDAEGMQHVHITYSNFSLR